jgi:gluconate kinase
MDSDSAQPPPALQPCTVWLSGNSGAGKTFVGDYLARVCSFHHVEGDAAMFSSSAAERAEFASFVQAFDHWFKSEPAPPALWHAYLERQVAAVRAARAAGRAHVVVSLTVYHREARDFLREQLPDHEFIVLRCSPEELVRRARVRFGEYAAVCGKSFEACFEANYKEPFSDAAFEAQTRRIMRGLQPLAPDEVHAHELDVTDGAPWRALHALLGLAPPPKDSEIPYEEIARTNYARFKAPPKVE